MPANDTPDRSGRDILTLEGGAIHGRLTHGGVADA